MEYIKIIMEIENKFNIKVPNMELIVEKFGSIKNLCSVISKQIKLRNSNT